MPENENYLQAHLPLPEQDLPDSTYLFSAYFWNPGSGWLKFWNYHGLLYELPGAL